MPVTVVVEEGARGAKEHLRPLHLKHGLRVFGGVLLASRVASERTEGL